LGLLRTFLALLVVIDHVRAVDPQVYIPVYGAIIAVKLFFVISGFYMSLVLDGRYQSLRVFYTNRFLRLAPSYYAVLGLILVLTYVFFQRTIFHDFAAHYVDAASRGEQAALLFYLPNLTILGSDLLGWICYDGRFFVCSKGSMHFLFVPQIWSVGLEIVCYLLCPFLIRKRSLLIASFVLCIGYYAILLALGENHEPWNRMVLPGQLLFFCMGISSFYLYKALSHHRRLISGALPKFAALFSVLAMVLVVTWFASDWPFGHSKNTVFFEEIGISAMLALVLPFIFLWTKNSGVDRLLGTFSYPIYLCHFFVFFCISRWVATSHYSVMQSPVARGIAYFIGVSIVSAALVYLIELPCERFRASRLKSQSRVGQYPAIVPASSD